MITIKIDNEENADWIKQVMPESHAMDLRIYADLLAEDQTKQEVKEFLREKGGPGSGFRGHSGRPGRWGGSQSRTMIAKPNDLPGFKAWFEGSKVVDKNGQPIVMFHGTSMGGFNQFDPERVSEDNLFGPGFYFTADPDVASTYAQMNEEIVTQPLTRVYGYTFDDSKKVGDIFHEDIKSLISSDEWKGSSQDMQKIPAGMMFIMNNAGYNFDNFQATLTKAERLPPDPINLEIKDYVMSIGTRAGLKMKEIPGKGPAVIPVYLSIKHPFDLGKEYSARFAHELLKKSHDDYEQHMPSFHRYGDRVSGDAIWQALMAANQGSSYLSKTDAKMAANEDLRYLGFDGITHVGGFVTNSKTHRVFIAFNPNQIKSAIYSKFTESPELTKGGAGSGNFGHHGRVGLQGGSARGSGKFPTGNLTNQADVGWTDLDGRKLFDGLIEKHGKVPSTYDRNNLDNFAFASFDFRGQVKDHIIQQLSDQTELPYKKVNDFIASWAGTSNDTSIRSLSIQKAISEEFGVPMSSWQKTQLELALKNREDYIQDKTNGYEGDMNNIWYHIKKGPDGYNITYDLESLYDEAGHHFDPGFDKTALTHTMTPYHQKFAERIKSVEPHSKEMHKMAEFMARTQVMREGSQVNPIFSDKDQRKLVRQMYENTQQAFADLGMKPDDKIYLYRGFDFPRKEAPDGRVLHEKYTYPKTAIGKTVGYKGNSAESWSISLDVAKDFGRNSVGIVVPLRNILATATTGFGCLTEGEFIVLGNNKIRVTVHASR